MTESKNIGLLGGTFDPVHIGHLSVAEHVRQTLNLDAVWFIPAALPPHKAVHADGRDITSFGHRLAMLEIATAGNSSYVVSDIEAKRPAPSYSIDTVRIMLAQVGREAALYFVIGADAFLEIDTWKRYKELPVLVDFVVISRPGYPPDKVGNVIRRKFPGYTYHPAEGTWSSPDGRGSFHIQQMKPVPISSTEIRHRISNGREITGLVPPAVEDYIKKHHLYRR
jgi:nicotinate-nucleotide adenylyltransferase